LGREIKEDVGPPAATWGSECFEKVGPAAGGTRGGGVRRSAEMGKICGNDAGKCGEMRKMRKMELCGNMRGKMRENADRIIYPPPEEW